MEPSYTKTFTSTGTVDFSAPFESLFELLYTLGNLNTYFGNFLASSKDIAPTWSTSKSIDMGLVWYAELKAFHGFKTST